MYKLFVIFRFMLFTQREKKLNNCIINKSTPLVFVILFKILDLARGAVIEFNFGPLSDKYFL